MVRHIMKLKDPWYSFISKGEKKIEGRINDDKRKKIFIGDEIMFVNENDPNVFILKKISKKKEFINFESALYRLSIDQELNFLLPGIKNLREGLNIYYNIPSYKEESEKNGVVLLYLSD